MGSGMVVPFVGFVICLIGSVSVLVSFSLTVKVIPSIL